MRGKAGIACTALCAKRDHPRVCGEKPRFCTYLHALKGSPPRMRGKVWRYFYYRGYHRITPAYAGKRRSLTPRLRRSRDHPRVCGEKPKKRAERVEPLGITPAYAGKRNQPRTLPGCSWDHPRVCGEKFPAAPIAPNIDRITPAYAGKRMARGGSRYREQGSPPRMRGKDFFELHRLFAKRITPAYAGKSLFGAGSGQASQDHPRVCGEKTPPPRWKHSLSGSPPRMRGKEMRVISMLDTFRITPAYAGKSILQFMNGITTKGSPPRMRGKVSKYAAKPADYRITPAYAGKSHRSSRSASTSWDHPRVCGEKVYKDIHHVAAMGSPPRMRGKGLQGHTPCCRNGITPAYAGKRWGCATGGSGCWDHPRVCGEKWYSLYGTMRKTGSPPRMRGKVERCTDKICGYRITPAYAGKSKELRLILHHDWDHPRVCGEKRRVHPGGLCRLGSPPRMRGKD